VGARFPAIASVCRQAGLDLATDRIPVSPAAHYVMGGVETDLDGRTSIEGLFAAGEVACTGVHGANRLASNSLLEGLVFGARAAAAMAGAVRSPSLFAIAAGSAIESPQPGPAPSAARIRDLMWRSAGLVRTRDALVPLIGTLVRWCGELAHERSQRPADRELRRLSSLATVGLLIARAALRREESRGGHFRADFPRRDDIHWHRHFSDVSPAPGAQRPPGTQISHGHRHP
jgi:L-aspartate oxidase